MDFVSCMNKSWRKIPENWESCAKETGMPVDKLKTCFQGQEGFDLLKASFEKAKARRATGSPTIYIGGKMYRGGRTEKAFTRAICDAYPKDKPELCASLPPPVKVAITILSDERCKRCRTPMIEQQMKGFFPGGEITVVDFGTEEGKRMYEELKLTKLPIILFGQEVKEAENYARLQRSLKPSGDKLMFSRYARFDPRREICDNKRDDTNNGKVDCDDPDCVHALPCRSEKDKKLELFVMSQCPYGVKALNSMKEVLDNFQNKIDFEVHFIASEQGDGFQALHGQPEVDENIRELCAIKLYPKNYKYMDYILCRNKNIRSTDWKSCTGSSTGIDTAKMEKCFSGTEGKNLLRKDIKIAEALNVTGSPTWYANNKFRFSGLDAESIKNNLCRHNKGMSGCDNKLTGPDKKTRGGGGSCR
jgi:predicted DsbA family dithiol-disulfide isomerase